MAGGNLVGNVSGLLEFEQEEKMLLRRHLGKASLWSVSPSRPALPIGSSGAPIILLHNTKIKQLLVSSSMDYNKYYKFCTKYHGFEF